MKHIFLLLLLCSTATITHAQIGMGGQPHPSAVLDLKSSANDKGLLLPRLSTAQRNAIVSPAVGLLVFDLDKNTLYLYDGQNWLPLATTSNDNLLPIDRTANDGAVGDNFGGCVALSGDYALVGARSDDIGSNSNQGSAYVFVRSGNSWVQQAKLTANDGVINGGFGCSVAISGDYALVGAPLGGTGSNASQGSAYVFVRNGTSWTQQAKLTASDAAAFDNLGWSVVLSGDYALVGAFNDAIGSNSQQGSACVFVRSGSIWTQQAKLIANDGAANDSFGWSVALSGDYALVGAYSDAIGSNTNQGSAYVFVRSDSSWTQQAKLTASDGTLGDNFGYGVALSGDYALVGAIGDDIGSNSNQGSAYVFVRGGTSWFQQAKLTANDGAAGDSFGISVALSGGYALVGAGSDDIGSNTNQGSAYVFRESVTSWTPVRQVVDSAPANTQNGTSVGLSNGTFIIGGPGFQSGKGKVAFGTVE